MRRAAATLICATALLGAGCDSGDEPESAALPPDQIQERLQGAPAPLAALHEQANELLDGGAGAFDERIRELRGYPVVVNKWASWCGPCRAEFPHFQRLALSRGREIGFLGVNSNDNDEEAQQFLQKYPVSYPSYKDPNLEVAARFKGVQAFPSTAFYDSKGELAYLKQGVYKSEADLAEDIERYAK